MNPYRSQLHRAFSHLLAAALLLAGLFGSAIARAADDAEFAFPPENTWLFVAGLLEWQDSENLGSFPKENRQDEVMVNAFRKAGVPDEQIVHIQDKKATKKTLQREFTALLERIPEDGVLLFYYAGHGYEEEVDGKNDAVFAPWDASDKVTGWSMRGVVEQIYDEFQGERALLLADCCHSGALVKAAREFAKSHPDGPAVAAVSSSSAKEVSTGDWTFTEGFIAALQGRPWTDLDVDGNCSLNEFGKFSVQEMGSFQAQHASFAVPEEWPGDALLAQVRSPKGGRIGERVNALSEGEWYKGRIIDEKEGKFRVRFVGYFKDSDLWLKADAIKPLDKPSRQAVGDLVEVKWKKEWWPAKVLEESDGALRVRYDGYGAEWDEWAQPERIRPRRK